MVDPYNYFSATSNKNLSLEAETCLSWACMLLIYLLLGFSSRCYLEISELAITCVLQLPLIDCLLEQILYETGFILINACLCLGNNRKWVCTWVRARIRMLCDQRSERSWPVRSCPHTPTLREESFHSMLVTTSSFTSLNTGGVKDILHGFLNLISVA